MAKASPIVSNFNAGELSPLIVSRTDLKYYRNGSKKSRNNIPTVQGPNRRRGGTRFVAAVKNSAHRTWLTEFQFNVQQVYQVEWGNLYARFFSGHGVVGAPFEVTTPYSVSDLVDNNGLFTLRYIQSNDVQYVVHGSHRQQKLTRTGASTFTMTGLETVGGPFKDIDPDSTTTVYASAASGTGITLTASSAIFQAGHVGTLFYLEQKEVDSIGMWEPSKVITSGDRRRSDGKNYTALNSATTGTIKPIHSNGAVFDGSSGVQWQFDEPGYGWVKITAIGGGGATATADVVSKLPLGAVGSGNATNRWAHSAWSDVEGWPTVVHFHRERLIFARGNEIWGSVAGDYENFNRKDDSGLVTADMSFYVTIASDRSNGIEWMMGLSEALLAGTAGDEHALTKINNAEAFGPGNIEARKQSDYGSRHVPVVRVGDGILFPQMAGRKIRDMRAAESVNERWVSPDLTTIAEHITKSGVTSLAYQQEPDSVVWGVKSNGRLIGLTINREQDVRGWHPHRIGGYSNAAKTRFAVVESITTTPSPDFDRDELWMIVRRTINGQTKRYVEYMEAPHEEGDDPTDAFYVDCGLTLNNTINSTLSPGTGANVKGTEDVIFEAGSAVFSSGSVGRYIHYSHHSDNDDDSVTYKIAVAKITGYTDTTHVTATIMSAWPSLDVIPANGWRMTVTTVSGLDHLEGEEVQVSMDGAVHPVRTVVGGAISLESPCSKGHVGLQYRSVMSISPLDSGAADGTAQGKTQRISRCGIRFHESAGAKYGRDESSDLDEIAWRNPQDIMDQALAFFTGTLTVSWPDGYQGEGNIAIVQDLPLPCCVTALMPQVVVQDSR